jgi:hypothetical protein
MMEENWEVSSAQKLEKQKGLETELAKAIK